MSEKVGGHVVRAAEGETDMLYIDLNLVHEVTSLRRSRRRHEGRSSRPELTLGPGPQSPTTDATWPIGTPSTEPVDAMRKNCADSVSGCT